MPLPAGTRLGPYEIVSPLGAGAMGEVYRARDVTLGRFVAVKVLSDSFANDDERHARFLREAQILAALNHPNIAAIYGWEQSSEQSALVMELVEGKPLTDHITRNGIPVTKALKYASQIATGLEAAHRAGVIHRDLKPSNVMITTAGNVKLLDFGLAKLAEASTSATTVTRTLADITDDGKVVGTVAYMSPEQAQGQGLDVRSDIFSFGSMLFEMLTGQRAFKRENATSTLAAILRDEPKPAGDATTAALPRDVEKLLRRCLRKDPERRFQTASDLRIALGDLLEDISSGQVDAVAEIPKRNRSPWSVWVALAVLALMLVGSFFWLRPRPSAGVLSLRQQTFVSGMALMPAVSPDGKLLAYASDSAGDGVLDLWVKQVAGGTAARLVSGMGSVSNPQFSLDGTRVYFLSAQNEIFEVSALGGPSRKLIDSAGPFNVSSRGDIAFVQPTTGGLPASMLLMSPGGVPSRWRPECLTAIPPAWSPDGQQLAFLGLCKDRRGLFLASRDGSSLRKIPGDALLPGLGREGPVMWSPISWFRLASGREGFLVPWRQGDTVNLTRLSLDGTKQPITQGTGWAAWPSVSPAGQIAFTRAEITPTIWSLPLVPSAAENERPRREASPAIMFTVFRDGTRLVFGRILGTHVGEVVSRDTATGAETILATHENILPVGSIWIQAAPDGSQVIYRVLGLQNSGHYLLSMTGGSARFLQSMKLFNVASDWFPDGKRILGECTPTTAGLCALDPDSGSVTKFLQDSNGELLFPSWSWDGKWLTFMRRRAGKTAICAAPVHQDGSPGGEAEWVEISPPDGSGSRPRFAPNGNSIFYLWNEKGVLTLVRQELDPATKHPRGPAARLAPVQVFPSTLAYSIGASNTVVGVSRDRVFFNSIDVRSNVWMTSIE